MTKARSVAVLLYEGICPFEFGLVTEVLSWPDAPANWYRQRRCSPDGRPVKGRGGMAVPADAGLEAIEEADVVIVPGWNLETGQPPPAHLLAALQRAYAGGARLVGLCTGAFLFGEAGLLRGRRVTTHWERADLFRRRFPGAQLLEQLYVDDGDVLTSSGSASGVDLLLHMVARDFGLETAGALSAHHTMAPHRAAEQAQKVERPLPKQGVRSLAPLLERILSHLDEPWTIQRMSEEVRMSPRTLVRRFTEATGSSPGEWVTLQRLLTARALLQQEGRHGVEDIAAAVGLGSAAALRHHFRRRFGSSPTEVRRGREPPRAVTIRARG